MFSCFCHRPELHSLNRRLGADLSRRGFVAGATAATVFPKLAAAQVPPARIVFANVRLFDGKADGLRDGLSVLVEGVGGIAAPIFAHYDFRDLARDLRLSVIIVAANRLGVLNHARLTVEAVRAAGLRCSLIALNSVHPDSDISQQTNLSILENLVDVPILAVEHNQQEFDDLVRHLW